MYYLNMVMPSGKLKAALEGLIIVVKLKQHSSIGRKTTELNISLQGSVHRSRDFTSKDFVSAVEYLMRDETLHSVDDV